MLWEMLVKVHYASVTDNFNILLGRKLVIVNDDAIGFLFILVCICKISGNHLGSQFPQEFELNTL